MFAYYGVRSGYLEQASPLDLHTIVKQSPVTSFVQNGSVVVDHFSSKGAQVVIDFWEEYLLQGDSRELIKEVGNYAWEDSMEIGAGALAWWTPQLLKNFRENRGYDLNKYLPLIFSWNTDSNGLLASPDHYFTDAVDMGLNYVEDYRQMLTEGNRAYLETLTNWSTSALQSQFSAQVVYNLPMDMLSNIPAVGAPECESLGFNHVIDAFRQFSGPANLAGKRVISSELGAQRNEVYSQTLPELIWDVKRSIAGSVNNFIYHGFPYTGSYPNTTWPGFTTFSYRFSNMHGPRQPSWEYYDDFMDWTARMQFVSQSGVPKMDLAFWLKRNQFYKVTSVYAPNDLQEAGFGYEYLSPDNFFLEDAVVENATLAPKRQAFKALILRANDTLTVPGVERLVEFAHQGLPIVFSGGLPQDLIGFNTSGTQYVRSALAGLVELQNVDVVPYDNLAASLLSLGITPRTRTYADRTLYTYWREVRNASVSYVYVYNDAWDSELGQGKSKGSITFETIGKPYVYDAWTGEVTPILAYQQTASTTTIPLRLAGNQTTVIGFHHNETTGMGTRPLAFPAEAFSASVTDQGHLSIKAGNATQPLLLSNGTAVTLPVPALSEQLDEWILVIESWSPPADLEAQQTKAELSNSTHHLTHLQPWNAISDSLRNTSGRGFYSTTFEWPPVNGSADGAMLDLGAITNTARVWINEHQIPPLDPTHAIADIGDCLTHGTNHVQVVVSTTLGNVLRPVYHQVKSSGTLWLGPVAIEQEYGLVSNVTIIPYLSTTMNI